MLLRHIGEGQASDRLEAAIAAVVGEGRFVTYDLRPDRKPEAAARTEEVADAVIARMETSL